VPKVSVISTVYNGEPYFARSVPSMLGQTLEHFEWVIVDDGSTDRTAELLAGLAGTDRRVRVLSPGRLERAPALNLAVEAAQCDYIANLDFDDSSRPDRLRLQMEFLDAHPEVGVLGGCYLVIDQRRNERFVRMPPERHEQIARAMANRIPFCHSVVMFRKAAWREAGGYPAVDKLIDFRLWIAIGALGWRFACLPAVLGEHFVYPESYFHRTFAYAESQRELARAQTCAIEALHLPLWTRIYPLGRQVYWFLPNRFKRIARRGLAHSRESDVPSA
jgi:glycosyltransferase involved in cell wall biosynthesis